MGSSVAVQLSIALEDARTNSSIAAVGRICYILTEYDAEDCWTSVPELSRVLVQLLGHSDPTIHRTIYDLVLDEDLFVNPELCLRVLYAHPSVPPVSVVRILSANLWHSADRQLLPMNAFIDFLRLTAVPNVVVEFDDHVREEWLRGILLYILWAGPESTLPLIATNGALMDAVLESVTCIIETERNPDILLACVEVVIIPLLNNADALTPTSINNVVRIVMKWIDICPSDLQLATMVLARVRSAFPNQVDKGGIVPTFLSSITRFNSQADLRAALSFVLNDADSGTTCPDSFIDAVESSCLNHDQVVDAELILAGAVVLLQAARNGKVGSSIETSLRLLNGLMNRDGAPSVDVLGKARVYVRDALELFHHSGAVIETEWLAKAVVELLDFGNTWSIRLIKEQVKEGTARSLLCDAGLVETLLGCSDATDVGFRVLALDTLLMLDMSSVLGHVVQFTTGIHDVVKRVGRHHPHYAYFHHLILPVVVRLIARSPVCSSYVTTLLLMLNECSDLGVKLASLRAIAEHATMDLLLRTDFNATVKLALSINDLQEPVSKCVVALIERFRKESSDHKFWEYLTCDHRVLQLVLSATFGSLQSVKLPLLRLFTYMARPQWSPQHVYFLMTSPLAVRLFGLLSDTGGVAGDYVRGWVSAVMHIDLSHVCAESEVSLDSVLIASIGQGGSGSDVFLLHVAIHTGIIALSRSIISVYLRFAHWCSGNRPEEEFVARVMTGSTFSLLTEGIRRHSPGLFADVFTSLLVRWLVAVPPMMTCLQQSAAIIELLFDWIGFAGQPTVSSRCLWILLRTDGRQCGIHERVLDIESSPVETRIVCLDDILELIENGALDDDGIVHDARLLCRLYQGTSSLAGRLIWSGLIHILADDHSRALVLADPVACPTLVSIAASSQQDRLCSLLILSCVDCAQIETLGTDAFINLLSRMMDDFYQSTDQDHRMLAGLVLGCVWRGSIIHWLATLGDDSMVRKLYLSLIRAFNDGHISVIAVAITLLTVSLNYMFNPNISRSAVHGGDSALIAAVSGLIRLNRSLATSTITNDLMSALIHGVDRLGASSGLSGLTLDLLAVLISKRTTGNVESSSPLFIPDGGDPDRLARRLVIMDDGTGVIDVEQGRRPGFVFDNFLHASSQIQPVVARLVCYSITEGRNGDTALVMQATRLAVSFTIAELKRGISARFIASLISTLTPDSVIACLSACRTCDVHNSLFILFSLIGVSKLPVCPETMTAPFAGARRYLVDGIIKGLVQFDIGGRDATMPYEWFPHAVESGIHQARWDLVQMTVFVIGICVDRSDVIPVPVSLVEMLIDVAHRGVTRADWRLVCHCLYALQHALDHLSSDAEVPSTIVNLLYTLLKPLLSPGGSTNGILNTRISILTMSVRILKKHCARLTLNVSTTDLIHIVFAYLESSMKASIVLLETGSAWDRLILYARVHEHLSDWVLSLCTTSVGLWSLVAVNVEAVLLGISKFCTSTRVRHAASRLLVELKDLDRVRRLA